MTDHEINTTILEYLGWSLRAPDGVQIKPLPDFVNDLNAMHQAWLTLTKGHEKAAFYCRLAELLQKEAGDNILPHSEVVNATSHQRAVAFLKTVGKWVE